MFIQFVKKQAPEYVELEIQKPQQSIKPIKVDLSSKEYQRAINLLEQEYEDKVLVDYCGATLPIVVDFKEVFGIDPLLVSLANDDCNMHGVDENFDIGLIQKGLKFSHKFFEARN
jgi:acetylornithine deacetylase/succinyl-diaminopimelate desuccinylase-like protein